MPISHFKAIYTCKKCRGEIITLQDDFSGHTELELPCIVTEGCSGKMKMTWQGFNDALVPAYEWVKPKPSLLRPQEWAYIRSGILKLQRIEPPSAPD